MGQLTYTTAQVQTILDAVDNKQAKVMVNGIVKGDGAGNLSAASSGTDYQAPLTAGTDYIVPPAGASNGNAMRYVSGAWAAQTVDTTVTQDSGNLVTSGAVYAVCGDVESVLEALL